MNVNKSGILIECPTEDEIDKLRAEVESNLREEIDIRSPIKVRPKLTIHRVEKDMDIEESIKNLNNEEHKKSDLKHKHIMETNKGNHWILSIDPETFQKVIELGKVNQGWYRLRIQNS
ncbi:hypothetical protein AVEN_174291-1 [Araneus ventricosus]|uniref:Uncharacterized protein n=1 Tax=Araneus ventricosus TaxID=182803 RepID=A0A4Y2N8J8_ARAVE|nr:hypothetical protein AVEN_174291-1 [Araneus ventricosus]